MTTKETQPDPCKEAFEAWLKRDGEGHFSLNKYTEGHRNLDEMYMNPSTQRMWLAWKAGYHAHDEMLRECREAFDKLARLGNEPEFGNSVGNVIAQQILTRLTQALGESTKEGD